MTELTVAERLAELRNLRERLLKSIEETARGITNYEIRDTFEDLMEREFEKP